MVREPVYFILKPFRIPAGLSGTESVQFVLLEGVPMPTGDLGLSILLDLNTKRCLARELSSEKECYSGLNQ